MASFLQGKRRASLLAGWAADRRLPKFLRSPVYRTYAKFTGANLDEMQGRIQDYPSLGTFFVRRLKVGMRVFDLDEQRLPSPVDCLVQSSSPVEANEVIEAKNRKYDIRELLDGVGADVELEGGHQFTLYLGPKDYHRVHCPDAGELVEAKHVRGDRFSVQPRVLAKRRVLPVNERVVLRIHSERGPYFMVLVGALIVGRIRIVGVEPMFSGRFPEPKRFARGDEVGRFEMGSTVVLVTPPGYLEPLESIEVGQAVKMGAAIARMS